VIAAVGKPDVRRAAPMARFDSFLGRSPSPHSGPFPSSSARRHRNPSATGHHLGLGAARSRPIRARIIREEEIDLPEFRDFADAYSQMGRFLDDVYNWKRIYSALVYLNQAEFEQQWLRGQKAVALQQGL
jgi:hypothetical protein